MKSYKYILGAICSISMLVSCDDHIIEDASWHSWTPGMVYSTNGDVTTFEQCIEKGNTPEAVLFYVDSSDKINGKAYAVSLHDNHAATFSNPDTIYVAQGTSADITTFDGEANTTALRYADIDSPIAKIVSPRYFIPSVAEMYMLYASRYLVNPVIEQCKGDILPVDDETCWYWTSTEHSVAPSDRACRFSLYSGRFESEDKHYPLPTRPIMVIRLNEGE
ncbi:MULTISPECIES: hypothetical protein [Bacteroides]|jgi:hypothetical protein|uniref:DUF1566 domain-containing protein n=1 Tax=Bacteroides uniformis TaxID=820 RepID=A0A3E4R8D5_BACUN|nr:hypothetical protein [Bacteroides uniformis]RGL16282.1 hypothetical protein DXC80_03690 [Bacteroides uniformis]